MSAPTAPSTPSAPTPPAATPPPGQVRPGEPIFADGELISTSPITGDEVGRFPVADAEAVAAAVARARTAARWWRELGFDERRARLLRWRTLMARRMNEVLSLMHAESGKTRGDAITEVAPAIDNLAWVARNAERVLKPRRVRGTLMLPEFIARLEYQPFGVIGVIGPWNYPMHTPMGSIAYALAAGNAVVFKPSEYSPAISQWYVDRFVEVVPEQPVLQVLYGGGATGEHLVRAGVDKVAFTGSPGTGRKIMAACAVNLTPVLIEGGGKDALIVDTDADLDLAASTCAWGAMTNAGQTCAGIERVYVAAPVYDQFLTKLVAAASTLKIGADPDADIGPITMPRQLDIIRRHIDDAIARGGKAVLGGPAAVQPPFVYPTILVDVPEDSAAVREETFGPTVTVKKVRDVDEAVALTNDSRYGLGGAVFGKARAMAVARAMRTGMVSVNGALTFAGMPALPFGGIGDSGFGRIHGDDGLREFSVPKSITSRRMRSFVPTTSYNRKAKHIRLFERIVRLVHGR